MRLITAAVGALALAPTLARAEDPQLPGAFEVERNEYGFGATAFNPVGFGFTPTEVEAVIHSPVDLGAGPFPLIVVLHGRHATCLDPDEFDPSDPFANVYDQWPCGPGREPVPSYTGYDYWAENLASHGFVIASIGANGIAAVDNAFDDGGAGARGQLIAEHLRLWERFNSTDEFGTKYNGAIDLDRVGLVGHSRGGEGVAAFLAQQAPTSPATIRAALLLAPVDFTRIVVPHVPLAVVLPYCDGDVYDLDGAHYHDDSRLAAAGDVAPKYTFSMSGSNHNFYNTVWSPGTFTLGAAIDDFRSLAEFIGETDSACSHGPSSERLSEQEQQQSLVVLGNAFFRAHLGGEAEYLPLLRGDVPWPAAIHAQVRSAYMPADLEAERIVLNSIDDLASLRTNNLGGAVLGEDLSTYDVCGVDPSGGNDVVHCVADPGSLFGDEFEGREPHVPGLAHLRLAATGTGRWINELGAPTDVSSHLWLQLRAAVDVDDPAYQGGDVDLSVVLVDADDVSATVAVSAWSDALTKPSGDLYPLTPKRVLGDVRIPISAFLEATPELDPMAIVRVELVFDRGPGAILVSDLLFADAVPPPPSTSSGGETSSAGSTSAAVDDSGASSTTAPAGTGTGTSTGDSGAGSETSVILPLDSGCGCGSASPRPTAVWLLALVAARRRRAGPSRARDRR